MTDFNTELLMRIEANTDAMGYSAEELDLDLKTLALGNLVQVNRKKHVGNVGENLIACRITAAGREALRSGSTTIDFGPSDDSLDAYNKSLRPSTTHVNDSQVVEDVPEVVVETVDEPVDGEEVDVVQQASWMRGIGTLGDGNTVIYDGDDTDGSVVEDVLPEPVIVNAPAEDSEYEVLAYGVEVEHDIPIPEEPVKRKASSDKKGRKPRYPFDTMEVGDSFFVAKTEKCPKPQRTLSAAISRAHKKYSVVNSDGETVRTRHFVSRSTGGDEPGVRIWRKA